MNTIFVFIRRLLSIALLLLILILLMLVPDYLETMDIASLLILLVLALASGLIAYKLWPKKTAIKSLVTPEYELNTIVEPVIESSLGLTDDSQRVQQSEEFNHNISNLEPTIPKPSTKTITINSIVVGMKYEGRSKRLKETINHLKSIGWYDYKYEEMSNSEIKDDIPFRDEDYPVWELADETLPFAEIVPEPENEFDSNAIAVYVGQTSNEMFKVGYLPKNDAKRIKDLIDNALLIDVTAIITGGKYKFVELDEYGEEKVRTRTTDYLLDLEIYFQKEID